MQIEWFGWETDETLSSNPTLMPFYKTPHCILPINISKMVERTCAFMSFKKSISTDWVSPRVRLFLLFLFLFVWSFFKVLVALLMFLFESQICKSKLLISNLFLKTAVKNISGVEVSLWTLIIIFLKVFPEILPPYSFDKRFYRIQFVLFMWSLSISSNQNVKYRYIEF